MPSPPSPELPAAALARTNWSGNLAFAAADLATPATVAELQRLLPTLPRCKALGSRHSFNAIADTPGIQIALTHLNAISLNTPDPNYPAAPTVTVGAGVTYGQLALWLHDRGFALPNLASLPHISVAGGTATATHGSGVGNGNLSTSVRALDLVTPDGQLRTLRRDPSLSPDQDSFFGSVVHLGALGVVTSVNLAVEPTFHVRQVVYEDLPFSTLADHFSEIVAAAYSVCLFTDWQGGRISQAWVKSRLEPSPSDPNDPPSPVPLTFFGARAATRNLHPLPGLSAENCTEQLGIPGPWHERLPHFRTDFTPSSGQELQSEFFVPLRHAVAAIRAVEDLRDRITPHLLISELRTVAADDLWLSPSYHQDSMTVHFTWKPDWTAVREILPLIEKQLAPFDAKPHWAKLFTMAPDHLRSLYPRMPDFLKLRRKTDPNGQLLNEYLTANLGL